MTRKELDSRMVRMIYRMTGQRYYLRDIDIVMEALPYVIAEGVVNDETISISGFGKFKPRYTKTGEWVSPKTGEHRTIESHRRISFKASQAFLRMIDRDTVCVEEVSSLSDEIDDA